MRAMSTVTKAVWRDASLIMRFRRVVNFSRQFVMARPPPARPKFSGALSTCTSMRLNAGIFTPAMLSVFDSTRTDACIIPSST